MSFFDYVEKYKLIGSSSKLLKVPLNHFGIEGLSLHRLTEEFNIGSEEGLKILSPFSRPSLSKLKEEKSVQTFQFPLAPSLSVCPSSLVILGTAKVG